MCKKASEQATESSSVGSTPPWSLLHFLPLDSCFKFLPWNPSMIDCDLEISQINLFLPQTAFGHGDHVGFGKDCGRILELWAGKAIAQSSTVMEC